VELDKLQCKDMPNLSGHSQVFRPLLLLAGKTMRTLLTSKLEQQLLLKSNVVTMKRGKSSLQRLRPGTRRWLKLRNAIKDKSR